MNIDGKVSIITGASSGIGRALSLAFLERGAKVVLAARRRDRLEEVVRSRPGEALVVQTDVTIHGELEHLVEQALSINGHIDVLVNNAGVGYGGDLSDLEPEDIEHLLRVNLLAPIWLTRLVLTHMQQRNRGLVVNISSIGGLVATPFQSAYCASKSGLYGFGEVLRRELIGTGIGILCVFPGAVDSEMVTEGQKKTVKELGMKVPALQSPDATAAAIIAAIEKNKRWSILGSMPERMLVSLNKRFPWLVDRAFSKLRGQLRQLMSEGNRWSHSRNQVEDSDKSD